MAIRNFSHNHRHNNVGNRSRGRKNALRQIKGSLLRNTVGNNPDNDGVADINERHDVNLINKPPIPYAELLSECDAWMDLFEVLRNGIKDDEGLLKQARGTLKSVLHDKGSITSEDDPSFEIAAARVRGLLVHYLDSMAEKFVGPYEAD